MEALCLQCLAWEPTSTCPKALEPFICLFLHLYMYNHVHMRVCVCVYIYVFIYIYIYIYTYDVGMCYIPGLCTRNQDSAAAVFPKPLVPKPGLHPARLLHLATATLQVITAPILLRCIQESTPWSNLVTPRVPVWNYLTSR